MNRYTETAETWDKLASLYQDKFMDVTLYDSTYDAICNAISKHNASLLEIGCGPGNITKYLLTKRPDFAIHGIDNAPAMIELARKNNPTASFEVMDSRQISILKTKYDGIVCGFCLPYLSEEDAATLIADCHDLLNENGLLYLSFVEGDPTKSGFQTGSSGHRIYFQFHDLENLKKQLNRSNFAKPEVTNVEYRKTENEIEIHTILITKRQNHEP